MDNQSCECHLDVYDNRSEFYQGDTVQVYYEGAQTLETQRRYAQINRALADGYLEDAISRLDKSDFSELNSENQALLRNLAGGITSEVGRALTGLAFLQLAVKSLVPAQSIRLHKGGTLRNSFSWKDGISMRTIDSSYITPFLREHGLLNINKYGIMMTRSLAENYPYTQLYKANMRGPFQEWIKIVDALENGSMPPKSGLLYLMSLLKNRSDVFREKAEKAVYLAKQYHVGSFSQVKDLLEKFFQYTEYSARAFEVVLHGFMQALSEGGYFGDEILVPLSQMRSANKKHGNIGDIELSNGKVIVESWDAKYGKSYLRDELEELCDKLFTSYGVRTAGFVTDISVDRRKDILNRANAISLATGVEIKLFSFDEWIHYLISELPESMLSILAERWLVAVVESFAQKRTKIAPIDEPCENWIEDLILLLLK